MSGPNRARPQPVAGAELEAAAGGSSSGTDRADLLHGRDGNETLNGGAGDDTVQAGNGDDAIIDWGLDNDAIDGEAGNDFIRAGDGDDEVYGGEGNDTVYGGRGDDTLYLGAGFQLFNTDGVKHHLRSGSDHLHGEEGNDTLHWMLTDPGDVSRFDGGAGVDTIKLDRGANHVDAVPRIDTDSTWRMEGNAYVFPGPTSGSIEWNGSVLHFTNVERIILPD